MKVVVTEFMDPSALKLFGAETQVVYDPALADGREALFEQMTEAEGLIVRNRTLVDAELIGRAPRLRVVGRLGVGLDNIDLAACEARGIAVRPAAGANTQAVAEYVIWAMLTLLRRGGADNTPMIAGGWPREASIGREAGGRTLGLLGYGRIARTVAGIADTLGMEVIAHDPHLLDCEAWHPARPVDLETLLHKADVLSLHVPLTRETCGIIGENALGILRPGAIVVNTARGGILDEAALAAALRSGRLGGAALDVFAQEPLSAGAAQVFAEVPNLILTPHIAGVTREANIRVSEMTVRHVMEELTHVR